MGAGYFYISHIGAIIIWTFQGCKLPYKEVRYDKGYPCFEVGLVALTLVVFLIYIYDYLF